LRGSADVSERLSGLGGISPYMQTAPIRTVCQGDRRCEDPVSCFNVSQGIAFSATWASSLTASSSEACSATPRSATTGLEKARPGCECSQGRNPRAGTTPAAGYPGVIPAGWTAGHPVDGRFGCGPTRRLFPLTSRLQYRTRWPRLLRHGYVWRPWQCDQQIVRATARCHTGDGPHGDCQRSERCARGTFERNAAATRCRSTTA